MARLLVIDDDDTFLDFLGRTLALMGYRVKIAHDGEEAIKILRYGYNFELIITDILMSNVDGIAVAQYIRSSDKADTPIVAITGDINIVNNKLFNSILIKPFKVKELIAVIKSLIKNT